MNEWKVNQEIYHRLHKNHDDDLNQVDLQTVEGDDIINWAVKYFTEDPGWVYPSKSYVVAICYAKWLTKDFAEDFFTVLNDPDLLYNNDPTFIPYQESKEIYDSIIEQVGLEFDETQGVIPDIKKYYRLECLLEDIQ
jgi:hypothetical protein